MQKEKKMSGSTVAAFFLCFLALSTFVESREQCSWAELHYCDKSKCQNEEDNRFKFKSSCVLDTLYSENYKGCKDECEENDACRGITFQRQYKEPNKRTCVLYSCNERDSDDKFDTIESMKKTTKYYVISLVKCKNDAPPVPTTPTPYPTPAPTLSPIPKCSVRVNAEVLKSKEKEKFNNAKPKLNIVFSLVDDMGWSDIGYENKHVSTPFLDELANGGVKLGRHYAFRFCSPSRSMFMTGTLPWRHGQHGDINLNPTAAIRCAVQEDKYFLSEHLKRSGYQNYMVGKWHLGMASVLHTPTYRGFDEYVGTYAGGPPPMNTKKYPMFQRKRCWCKKSDGFCSQYKDLNKCSTSYQLVNNSREMISVVPVEDFEDGEYVDLVVAREAVRMIKNHDPEKGPMFLYTSYYSPHTPIISPKRFQDLNTDIHANCRKNYAGMMSAVDEANKLVVDALKAKGLWDNTLFIFSSDNGGNNKAWKDCTDDPFKTFQGSNYPLRGSKWTFWEGGIRVQSFVHSPIIPEARRGKTWNGLVSLTDWFQTIITAAGLPQMEDDYTPPDSKGFWDELISDNDSQRNSLKVQVWKEDIGEKEDFIRYVSIEKHNGHLYKYIQGYPGYVSGNTNLGYNKVQDKIPKWTPQDSIWKPEEITPDSTVPNNDELEQTCHENPCLFNLDTDPYEAENLLEQPNQVVYTQIAEKMIDNIEYSVDNEMVLLPDSGLCLPDFVITGKQLVTDKAAYNRAEFCGYFVPWLDENLKVIPNKE